MLRRGTLPVLQLGHQLQLLLLSLRLSLLFVSSGEGDNLGNIFDLTKKIERRFYSTRFSKWLFRILKIILVNIRCKIVENLLSPSFVSHYKTLSNYDELLNCLLSF